MGGVLVHRYKQRNQEGAMGGHAEVTYKLGKTAFRLSIQDPIEKLGGKWTLFLFLRVLFLLILVKGAPQPLRRIPRSGGHHG